MDDVPRSDIYDDVYFSKEGGPAETRHVFLDGNDLPRRWQGCARHTIGETGFGTGLNFLLAWKMFEQTAPQGAFLDFVSVEKHPLSPDEIRNALKPWASDLSPYLEKMLGGYPMRIPGFHRMVFDDRVALTLIFDDVNEAFPQISGQVDTWFLDGFTPSKNPDMWTQTLFNEMARLSHDDTVFSTFTAAGFVKRGLQDAGFIVQKKKGFGSKRDMLSGYFQGAPKTNQHVPKNIAVLGAGIAGASCAHVFKQYGFAVTLYDENGIASGASGNPLGLINPRLSALRDAQSDFYAAAFAQAHRTYSRLHDIEFAATGALHLVTDESRRKRFRQTIQNWEWPVEHMRYLDAQCASDIAGIAIDKSALYLPDSAGLSPYKLCLALSGDTALEQKNITDIAALPYDAVILANGIGAASFSDLPIHTVRGQITQIGATECTQNLRVNLHYGGYFSTSRHGVHTLGATFQKWIDHTDIVVDDNDYNIHMLQSAVPSLQGEYRVLGARASLRCASKDRFPIIGRLDNTTYITTAHGSHGLVSAIAGAHLLADLLRGGIKSQSDTVMKRLSPCRFKNL